MNEIYVGIGLFIIINVIGYVLMFIDKRKAKKNKWRISEKTLLFVGFIGGALGMHIGMNQFHHKTKHKLFFIGLKLFILIHIILLVLLLRKLLW